MYRFHGTGFRSNPNPKLIYFFAGYDTTAHSISWTLLELAKHPKEQEKLYQALRKYQQECRQQEKEGKEGAPSTSKSSSASELMSWKYCSELKNVTREILTVTSVRRIGLLRHVK